MGSSSLAVSLTNGVAVRVYQVIRRYSGSLSHMTPVTGMDRRFEVLDEVTLMRADLMAVFIAFHVNRTTPLARGWR